MSHVRTWLVAGALVLSTACGRDGQPNEAATVVEAQPIGVAECAACGMVVREQPAPRAQLVHHDGTRQYFCSIGDLAHYLQAPSPHGRAIAIFVEVDESASPEKALARDATEASWVPADAATFLVGIERPKIMGAPALTFSTRADAERVRAEIGGELMDWSGARAYLVQQAPESAHSH